MVVVYGGFVFSGKVSHHRPPLPWWQVVVVEQMESCCCSFSFQSIKDIVYCYLMCIARCGLNCIFPAKKQPPPATVIMVAGGGGHIHYHCCHMVLVLMY